MENERWYLYVALLPASFSAGEVLPQAEPSSREGGGVQSPVPHLHRSRSPAVVWQNRTGPGLHRYKKHRDYIVSYKFL